VDKAKEHIKAGDIFQAVLSQRFTAEVTCDPFNVYRALRIVNPSPYMFFLKLGECSVIGSSPEMLVRIVNGKAYYRPIAGTRPRGANEDEDALLAEELKADEKRRPNISCWSISDGTISGASASSAAWKCWI
jgi:anthranilate synthase component 1